MTNGYPSGTTERDRREAQEFDGIRTFAPLGESDPAWAALKKATTRLNERETENELLDRTKTTGVGMVRDQV